MRRRADIDFAIGDGGDGEFGRRTRLIAQAGRIARVKLVLQGDGVVGMQDGGGAASIAVGLECPGDAVARPRR